jgi:hypothetical protein
VPGWRNGYRCEHPRTAEDVIESAPPQTSNRKNPFRSKIRKRLATRRDLLEQLEPAMCPVVRRALRQCVHRQSGSFAERQPLLEYCSFTGARALEPTNKPRQKNDGGQQAQCDQTITDRASPSGGGLTAGVTGVRIRRLRPCSPPLLALDRSP